MNKTTHFHRATGALFGVLALSIAGLSHAADGVSQKAVQYGDLDVSRTAGAAALYSRISGAAKSVCKSLDGDDLAAKSLFDRCVHKAVTDAVTAIDQPALYSLYNTKNPAVKSIILASASMR
jgi:UrcA family protein